ncbi:MAG TPA: phosphoenolpyruvate synthase [Planococcus sp. (in: firmicutes)]|nr:phosphoenolpyruvate synthase [Planococcus sp. (in: firmicutes)]
MRNYRVDFQDIRNSDLPLVGGKGLNLGALAKIPEVTVPAGFCITAAAYKKIIAENPEIQKAIGDLSACPADDLTGISHAAAKIRGLIEAAEIPEDIRQEIVCSHAEYGEHSEYAVRSSATAEDLPSASFAGQQDTYLNIKGTQAILHAVRRCWASLFTERAAVYRSQNGFAHGSVFLAVIIQRMIFPQVSGILFTADPVSSNRKMLSIDASFGLGEALVSGVVSADNYKVQNGQIVQKTVSAKKIAVYPVPGGGTEERAVESGKQQLQALSDSEILKLAKLGRHVEAHFRNPQDIEWCIDEDQIFILQSRPITTLFPLPPKKDDALRLYMSIGHRQMMTAPINPLGMSFFRFMPDIPMDAIGGRLYFDISHDMASWSGKMMLVNAMRKSDIKMHRALADFVKRKERLPTGKRAFKIGSGALSWKFVFELFNVYFKNDRAIVKRVIAKNEASLRQVAEQIGLFSGDELISFLLRDQENLRKNVYDPQGLAIIMVGIYAMMWINENMEKWLGEKNAADALSQSIRDNVTSEMGLDLLDVADAARDSPAVIRFLQNPDKKDFFESLQKLEGGKAFSAAYRNFLDQYGMRCAGEIDITQTRWIEQPSILAPAIVSNIHNFRPNEKAARLQEGKFKAEMKERELLNGLERQRGGRRKIKKLKKRIRILDNYLGFREYPKFAFIKRYGIYKQALMEEAALLRDRGVIRESEDIYYLFFNELQELVRTGHTDYRLIEERKADYRQYSKMVPPRLITSEGEVLTGEYDIGNMPAGALPGIAVSSGIVEGRARVIMRMQDASLAEGDILVTSFTDPSWTPLFVAAKGLVTEVGGLMTHGAVIAREYGLPAVVGVENATRLIKDGQHIRINGSDGFVEILS